MPGVYDQMNVIRHQAVAVDLQIELRGKFTERLEIRQTIALGDEHDSSVVSTLNYVVREVCNRKSCSSWHPCLLSVEP